MIETTNQNFKVSRDCDNYQIQYWYYPDYVGLSYDNAVGIGVVGLDYNISYMFLNPEPFEATDPQLTNPSIPPQDNTKYNVYVLPIEILDIEN